LPGFEILNILTYQYFYCHVHHLLSGCSSEIIIVTLINVLKQNNAKYGAAGICKGGGGASAIVIEAVN